MALISDRFTDDGQSILQLSYIQQKYIGIYNRKCETGEYSYRKLECECGQGDFEVIAKKDRYGIPIDTVICRNCGLIITNPCLDDPSNNEFYDNEYPYIYRAEEKPSEEVFQDGKRAAGSIISFIRKYTGKQTGKVLEIGCADGRNIAAFDERGYDACGIDLSHTYVEFGKNKGLNLICTDAETFEKQGHKFDIIVLNHVLEHFTNPGRELGVIRRMLKPEGCLFVAVPGVRALAFNAYEADFLRMLQNAHIYNFTGTTLCNVMKKYGFASIYCNEFIYSVFRKCDPEVSFNNAYEETMSFLRKTEEVKGNIVPLLIERAKGIISSYGEGEVLLYGTAIELDVIVQKTRNLAPIKGFFYTDAKTPEEVAKFIRTSGGSVKCILVVDTKENKRLVQELSDAIDCSQVNLYSVYSEIF